MALMADSTHTAPARDAAAPVLPVRRFVRLATAMRTAAPSGVPSGGAAASAGAFAGKGRCVCRGGRDHPCTRSPLENSLSVLFVTNASRSGRTP